MAARRGAPPTQRGPRRFKPFKLTQAIETANPPPGLDDVFGALQDDSVSDDAFGDETQSIDAAPAVAADQLDVAADVDAPSEEAPVTDFDPSSEDNAPDLTDAAAEDNLQADEFGTSDNAIPDDDTASFDLEFPDLEELGSPELELWFDTFPGQPAIAATDDSAETLSWPQELLDALDDLEATTAILDPLLGAVIVLTTIPCIFDPEIAKADAAIANALVQQAAAIARGDSYSIKFWADQAVYYRADRAKWVLACSRGNATLNENDCDRDFRRKG